LILIRNQYVFIVSVLPVKKQGNTPTTHKR